MAGGEGDQLGAYRQHPREDARQGVLPDEVGQRRPGVGVLPRTSDGRVHVMTEIGELIGLLDLSLSNRVLAEYRQRKAW